MIDPAEIAPRSRRDGASRDASPAPGLTPRAQTGPPIDRPKDIFSVKLDNTDQQALATRGRRTAPRLAHS